ncbi:amidohydrolase family protein [Streptomyces sp. NBC_01762]|uniref:amidohydrolase family protein n=1 Tax=Streptomyces sp. NBC_01762 TaxID=2975933 RepID=UPI002DD9EFAF|nr:amidohydrolase family protein [Streptomyces sp. NBC_01762]WSC49373.1 amidohydrolase family protein [Streptomyces sp. NBC_01762]
MRRDAAGILLRNVEVYPHGARADCRIRRGHVARIGHELHPAPGELVIRGDGGALLPGLADHHLHLTATAARDSSLDVSALSRGELAAALAEADAGDDGWVRVVGHDEVAHGNLDRDTLDAYRGSVPMRLQHRSGALWSVNSAGLARLGADHASHVGIERDLQGRPTGRLWRADDWLRDTLDAKPPSLRSLGARLASLGLTHVADATPDPAAAEAAFAAVRGGELPQYVMVMAEGAGAPHHPRLSVGPVKVVVTDHELPDLDDLAGRIARAHAVGRAVAVHCVSRVALALTLAALDQAGVRDGDRVEHGAVADPAAAGELARRGVRVVTQPTLVALRGDDYWQRTDPGDRVDLWRYGTLVRAGVRVAPSSDAPYGDLNPWACLRAAAGRHTPSGRVLGPDERLPARDVLRGMLAPLDDPGGPPRRIAVGSAADLVLLDRPLTDALRSPHARHVRATLIAGQLVYCTDGPD